MPVQRWWSMSKIYVIGIDGSGTLRQRRDILERCGLIVASKRLAALLGNTFVLIHPITPIEEAFDQISEVLEGERRPPAFRDRRETD